MSIELKLDNPQLEALLERVLEKFLGLAAPAQIVEQPAVQVIQEAPKQIVAEAPSKPRQKPGPKPKPEPQVITKLASTKKPVEIPDITQQSFLDGARELLELKRAERDQEENVVPIAEGKQVLCSDKFPQVWREQALEKFKQKQAFTLRDIANDRWIPGVYAAAFKNWAVATGKVFIERLEHIPNRPFLYVPFWEEHGHTKIAKNAHEFKGKLTKLVDKMADNGGNMLSDEDIEKLEAAGIRVRA